MCSKRGLPFPALRCFACFSHAHDRAGKVPIAIQRMARFMIWLEMPQTSALSATTGKVYPDVLCCGCAQTMLDFNCPGDNPCPVRLLPMSVPRYALLDSSFVLQLLSWKAYSAAKRAGTLPSLLESMRPPEAEQAGRSKRKNRNTQAANVEADAPLTDDDNTAKPGPVKRLKTTVSNCRMM